MTHRRTGDIVSWLHGIVAVYYHETMHITPLLRQLYTGWRQGRKLLQARSPCLYKRQHGAAPSYTLPTNLASRWTSRLEGSRRLYVPSHHRRRLSAVRGCQPSVTEPFLAAVASGTVRRSTPRLQHHCRLQQQSEDTF